MSANFREIPYYEFSSSFFVFTHWRFSGFHENLDCATAMARLFCTNIKIFVFAIMTYHETPPTYQRGGNSTPKRVTGFRGIYAFFWPVVLATFWRFQHHEGRQQDKLSNNITRTPFTRRCASLDTKRAAADFTLFTYFETHRRPLPVARRGILASVCDRYRTKQKPFYQPLPRPESMTSKFSLP